MIAAGILAVGLVRLAVWLGMWMLALMALAAGAVVKVSRDVQSASGR